MTKIRIPTPRSLSRGATVEIVAVVAVILLFILVMLSLGGCADRATSSIQGKPSLTSQTEQEL